MLTDTRLDTDVENFYGHIKLLLSEAASLMRLAHQHLLIKNQELANDMAADARDRAQSAAALLSSNEDCDIIKLSHTLGTRRLLYVTIDFPRQQFVIANVIAPDNCYFCKAKLTYGSGSVAHVGYVSVGRYTCCDTCNCSYHQVHDTPIEPR